MSKLVEYVGTFHILKERVRETWTQYWTSSEKLSNNGHSSANHHVQEVNTNFRTRVSEKLERLKQATIRKIDYSADSTGQPDFSHVYRPKTRKELLKISAAVMGIEFAYAAETAFVSPLLLNLGLRHRHLTLIWFLSPVLGFFITPLLGSLSDGCRSQLGRRRPFIILLSIGIILGLILVPNGKQIGIWFGDTYERDKTSISVSTSVSALAQRTPWIDKYSTTSSPGPPTNLTELNPPNSDSEHKEQNSSDEFVLKSPEIFSLRLQVDTLQNWMQRRNEEKLDNVDKDESTISKNSRKKDSESNITETNKNDDQSAMVSQHSWGLIFTVVGTVLLDFDADACQSPSRAFMLDITLPEDHARGLSAFTVMAGLGGSIGYFLGALNWENTFIGDLFGGHVRAVFTLILFIFVGCVVTTLRSFQEIPIDRLWTSSHSVNKDPGYYVKFNDDKFIEVTESNVTTEDETSFNEGDEFIAKPSGSTIKSMAQNPDIPTFQEYLKTIIQLPKSLQWLCLTNFFSWISLVCYSLYFTDFVGEAVFGGDPAAPPGSKLRVNYEYGVRFGCAGMSLYSLSCAVYSLNIQILVQKFGSKQVYICGQLVYAFGMMCMAITRHPAGVLIFSWTAGIMYATLFTMPYLLVARYHAADTFGFCPISTGDEESSQQRQRQRRGLGTDVAIVSSMVFLAQMTQALTLGSIVAVSGTTTAVVCAASVLAFFGALSATKVLYLDL